MKAKFLITRYELYGDPPTHRIVGFKITRTDLPKSDYLETLLLLDDIKGDDDQTVLKKAFASIKPDLLKSKENIESISSIVNSEYVPTPEELF